MKAGQAVTLILTLLLAYVGLYFAVLALPDRWRLPDAVAARPPKGELWLKYLEIDDQWQIFPDYHGLPPAFFVPMHELDRRYLRPTRWEGVLWNRHRERDFDWMLKAVVP